MSTNFQGTTPSFTQKTVTGAPAASPIAIAIDPLNTDRVVVVYPGFSGTLSGALSKHVFLTTDAGTTWADIGGTALDATQMVPDMPLYSVVIDPQTTPHSVIVSTDLGVLRTLDNGATWQRLGIGLPNVNATSLQIDYTVTPSLLRVGTYGRSAFELTSATGPLLAVNCDLGFGFVTVNTTATRQCSLFNVGSADLHVNGFFRASGSTRFTITSGPATPVTIAPGSHVDYTIAFSPTSPGDLFATFQVNSDDQFQPVLLIPASGTGVTGNINVSSTHLEYGGVAVDNRTNPSTKTLTTTVSNQASCAFCDLHVTGLAISGANAADFAVVGAPSLPFTLGAGNAVNISVRFNPSAGGLRTATLTISSDDPFNPSVAVALDGTGLKPAIDAAPATLIFGPAVFDPNCGSLCGSTLPETFTNSGQAELIVDAVTFTGPFSGPAATSPPTRVEVGGSLIEQVTFHPLAAATKVTGNLHVEDSFPLDPGNVVAKDVPLCGEAVGRGIRVLAVDPAGVPVPNVDMLKLTANGVSSPPNINLKNLPLQTVDPPASCQRIQMALREPGPRRHEPDGAEGLVLHADRDASATRRARSRSAWRSTSSNCSSSPSAEPKASGGGGDAPTRTPRAPVRGSASARSRRRRGPPVEEDEVDVPPTLAGRMPHERLPSGVRAGREEDLGLEALVVHTGRAVAGGGDRILDQHRDVVDRPGRDRLHDDVASAPSRRG